MNALGAWLAVAGTVLGLAVGQVLFKKGASTLDKAMDRGGDWSSWLNPHIFYALVLYAVSTVMWISALRSLPLRIAYPVSAIGFILVPVLGHFFLDEPLSWRSLAGGAIIVAGVILSTSAD